MASDRLTSVEFDPDKYFAEELRIQIQMFDNRQKTGDPLTASELLVQIPREKFERLCRLSLEALEKRYKDTEITSRGSARDGMQQTSGLTLATDEAKAETPSGVSRSLPSEGITGDQPSHLSTKT